MLEVNGKASSLTLIALLCVLPVTLAAQQLLSADKVPANFTADAAFASHVRSILLAVSQPATGPYAIGQEVLHKLVQHLPAEEANYKWELRIAPDAGNVFSSPDGTILVDERLAQFLGSQSGLWAAALSHEIAHVRRRDWARRYLLETSLEQGRASQVVLGDASMFAGSWVDARGSTVSLETFCRTMELEADAESLLLMAHAGFHPDFVPALHHMLEALPGQSDSKALDASHPRWDERDEELRKRLGAAGKEYDRLWPARYASPGGNPPVVVYAGLPSAKRDDAGEMTVSIPLHCQNLAGSVEVILRWKATGGVVAPELQQFTGCTSKRTLITFTLPGSDELTRHSHLEGDVSILDDKGVILTRSLTPIPVR